MSHDLKGYAQWPIQDLPRDLNELRIENREKLRALEKAISELPQPLKSPLILTALEGRYTAQTRELLGMSPKGVEMKIYRVRKLLLAKMQEFCF